MSKSDGGPAFPQSYIGIDIPHEGIGGGMSLRDYCAIHATDQDVASAAQAYMHKFGKEVCSVAEARYYHADSMIVEWAKQPHDP